MAAAALTALPAASLDSHVGILGIQGAGKTYAAKGEVELLLDAGRRACVIDPTGVWWGLRLGADGGTDGGYPVVIFGGDHGDVPITGASGAKLAEIVAEGRFSCVIDVVRMTVGERTRLFADFAEQLAMRNRRPLHLVIDEAHLFAPQGGAVQDPKNARMVGAANHLVSGGRALGLRVMLLTQRPAKLHKDCLTQVQTLVAMRVISPQDRAAVKAWIGDWVEAELGAKVLTALPALPTGTGFVWAPTQGVLSEIRFRAIRTFDSSRTPEHEDDDAEPVQLGALPLDDLRAALAEAEEDATPKASTGVKAPAPSAEALKAERDRAFRSGYDRGYADGVAAVREAVDLALERVAAQTNSDQKTESPALAAPAPAEPAKPAPARPAHAETSGLSASAKKLLQVLNAPNLPRPVTWSEAAVLAVLVGSGGSFNLARKQLIACGRVTLVGREIVAGTPDPAFPLLAAATITRAWGDKLGGSARRILNKLYGAPATKAEIARALDLAPSGGSWNTAWKQLRGNNLVEECADGYWRLAAILRELKGETR